MNDTTLNNTASGSERRRNKSSYLILAAIFGPMLAAYVIFKTGIGIPTGTINKGVLLAPPVSLALLDDMPDYQQSADKWRLLVPVMAPCDQACEQALYITRQVHLRLNEKAPRVARLVLADPRYLTDEFRQLLADQHPGVALLPLTAEQWQSLIAGSNWQEGQYAMVDQSGFMMMYYQSAHSGNDLLTDLKRMLKLSREH